MNNDRVINFIKLVFGEDFPQFSIDSWFQNNGITQFGSISNNSFKGTKFHFDISEKKLLHFTTLNNLKLILESESLRVSNFNTFSDPKEMVLSGEKIFNLSLEDKLKAKRGLFALSLTEMENDNVKEKYDYMWEHYGNNYKGVAMELEIDYSASYYPLTIQYPQNIEQVQIIKRLKKYYAEYFGDNIADESVISFLYPLLCAFKSHKFSNEKEVRIFFQEPNLDDVPNFADSNLNGIKFNISDNNEPIYYWNVPLILGKIISNEESVKFIRLKKIHLGKNASNCNEFGNYTSQLISVLEKKCSTNSIDFVW